jgi:arylsulfatase A-like enzyme
MPLASLGTRAVALAAVVGTAGLGLSACDGQGGPGAQHRTHYTAPTGKAPVGGPHRHGLGLGQPMTASPFHQPVRRPNLLMITADDAAWNDMQYMPHLRRLMVDQGITLKNGMAPTPICVPARASLLSGQYAHNHGAVTINGAGGGVSAFTDTRTLPVWLQSSGYRTMFVGKYLNGYGEADAPTYVPPGWSDWHGTVDPSTYNYVMPTVNNNGHLQQYHRYSSNVISDISNRLLARPQTARKP